MSVASSFQPLEQLDAARTVYTPPQDPGEIVALMGALERFVNEPERFAADPLVKRALIHHRFETIHPFYDGNGRTGRILNVLPVKEGLLDIPVLYPPAATSCRHKADYDRLLQAVREDDCWEEWVIYMLEAVERTAAQGIATIGGIKTALFDYKRRIRAGYRFYSPDLINKLFTHPYTKIEPCAARPAGLPPHRLQVPRCAGRGRLRSQAEGGPEQLLRQPGAGRSDDGRAPMTKDQLEHERLARLADVGRARVIKAARP